MFDFDREQHERERARSAAWFARHKVAITSDPPGETEAIAAELLIDAQRALLNNPPWSMDLERPVALQLEFFGLLDQDGDSLNDLGVGVLRTLLHWEVDYARRDREFGEWFSHHYAAANSPSAPGHDVAHAALYLHPDLHEPLIDIATQGNDGVTVAHTQEIDIVRHLAGRGLVTATQIRCGRKIGARADITELGRQVVWMFRIARQARERIFAGARLLAVTAESDRNYIRAMEVVTSKLGRAIISEDKRSASTDE